MADAGPQRTLFSGADLNKRAAAWLAVVDILRRVETHPYHWPVGRVIFHKILYFATEAGLATGLQFSPGSYGPYSAAAEPLVSKLINNGLIVEIKSGRMFRVQVGSAFADARRAYAAQLDASSAIQERVADLFLRVNTHQAEVAATVHYAATHLLSPEAEPTEKDVLLRVMQWKQRRQPQWGEEEVAVAIRDLNMLGWIKVKGSRDLPLPQGERNGSRTELRRPVAGGPGPVPAAPYSLRERTRTPLSTPAPPHQPRLPSFAVPSGAAKMSSRCAGSARTAGPGTRPLAVVGHGPRRRGPRLDRNER